MPDDGLQYLGVEMPPIDARTFSRIATAGLVGLVAWEGLARVIAPLWIGTTLDPTGLIEAAIGLSGLAAEALHLLTGLVLFPLGYVLIVRPLVLRLQPALPWPVIGIAYGAGLWVFAMYVMASLLGGMPPFLGFEPVAWASLVGHLALGLGIAATDALLPRNDAIRRWTSIAVAGLTLMATPLPADAAADGLVTQASRHSVRETLNRFETAVRDAGWKVFAEIDHAAAAQAVGMSLGARTVVLFGNPRGGTPAMQAHPMLAIDLPMRVLVWQDSERHVFVTHSTGADMATRVFARHGITVPSEGQRGTDTIIEGFVRKAIE